MKKIAIFFLVLSFCFQMFSLAVFAEEPETEAISLPLKRLAIYYSWPSAVNGAGGNIEKAAAEFAKFDLIVFADTLQKSTHGDHENTKKIIEKLNELDKKVFGYVDLGLSKLPIDTIKTNIDEWASMGVYGIFLDTAGFDYGVTRERQNTVVDYVHSKGLKVFMNAWDPDDVCGDLDENGNENPSHLGEGDWYLAESWMISSGRYFIYFESDNGDVYNWLKKAEKCLYYRQTKGIQTAVVVTSNDPPKAGDHMSDKFRMAWWAAAMFGFPFQWTDIVYSSTSSVLYDFPELNRDFGTSFTGKIVYGAGTEIDGLPGSITRATDKGTIHIEIKTDGNGKVIGGTGYFSPPVLVDGKSSEWVGINPIPGGTVSMKITNDLENLYLIVEGSGLTVEDQFYFDTDNNTETGFTSWAVKGADYFLQSGALYKYIGDGTSWAWDIENSITLSSSQFVVSTDGSVIEISIPLANFDLEEKDSFGIGYIHDENNRIPKSGNNLPVVKVSAFPPASTNAELKSLQINPVSILFDSNKKEYGATVPYNVSKIDVLAMTSDEEATMKINGEVVNYGSEKTIPLDFGNNTVQINITAADGETTNEYRIDIYRETINETLAEYPSIIIDGDTSDWNEIEPLAVGINIIKRIKVTNDKSNLYLLAEGDNLDVNTPVGYFYINTDNNTSTGFSGWGGSGAEYMLQNEWFFKYSGDGTSWGWDGMGTLSSSQFVKNSNTVEISIPLSDLKISKGDIIGVGYVSNDASWAINDILPETASELTTVKLLSELSSADLTISRGEFVELLVGAMGLTAEIDSNFQDVNSGDTYYNSVGVAKKLGITKGVGDNKFNPDESITRQDMMVMAARALKVSGKIKEYASPDVLSEYIDANDISNYAAEAVATLVKEGIILGSGNRIDPKEKATRAEVAVVLNKIYNKYC